MPRQVVNAILDMPEYNRFSKGIFSWVGYRTKWLEYENVARVAGETKWSFWKLLLYSIDGIIGFSTFPLAIASVVGVLFCVVAFILILFFFFKTLIWFSGYHLHHFAAGRHSAVLRGHFGTVSEQDLSGNQKTAYLYRTGGRGQGPINVMLWIRGAFSAALFFACVQLFLFTLLTSAKSVLYYKRRSKIVNNP